MNLTRRLFLSNSAAAGVTAAIVASPAVVEAAQQASAVERAQYHWQAFCAAIEELTPDHSDCRLQFFANYRHGSTEPFLRVEAMRQQMEQVHPKVRMPVERCVESWRLSATGWKSEGWQS